LDVNLSFRANSIIKRSRKDDKLAKKTTSERSKSLQPDKMMERSNHEEKGFKIRSLNKIVPYNLTKSFRASKSFQERTFVSSTSRKSKFGNFELDF
jgi:hypothetical protein